MWINSWPVRLTPEIAYLSAKHLNLMKRFLISFFVVVGVWVSAGAQVGYQVTVFDQTKNEPKANQSVTATVTITDNTGAQIVSQTYTGTTDEFGILSMTIGNANSFDNANWNNLPFWVSATVDGVTISKTQMLSVPVAEYAKQTGQLTKQILCSKTWKQQTVSPAGTVYLTTITFNSSGTGTYKSYIAGSLQHSFSFSYSISGNTVAGSATGSDSGLVVVYNPANKTLIYGSTAFR